MILLICIHHLQRQFFNLQSYLSVLQRTNQCVVRNVHESYPPLWEWMYEGCTRRKFITGEVGSEGSEARQNSGYKPKHRSRKTTIRVSTGEVGQWRKPGMDDVIMFGITTERLRYKWMNCADSEWKPRKAVSFLTEVPWGDRSSLRGKDPGWIKNLRNFQILFSASPLLIWEKEVWLSVRRFWDRTSPREEVKSIIRKLETGQSLWLHRCSKP